MHIQYLTDTLTQKTNRFIKDKLSLHTDWHQDCGCTTRRAQRSHIWLPRMFKLIRDSYMCTSRQMLAIICRTSWGQTPFLQFQWSHKRQCPSLLFVFFITQNGQKSIKKCKWAPQLVYIINFIQIPKKNQKPKQHRSFRCKSGKHARHVAL